MLDIMDKRDRAALFRARLNKAMDAAGYTQSGLSRATGTDRSTISQALSGQTTRLPGAHIAAACAQVLGVSADWLLGLSDRPESVDVITSTTMTLTEASRALIDEQIFGWHREAAGYKIRHVSAGLPDMLKTDAMLVWEYGPHLGRTTTQAINASRDRLSWMQASQSDYEIAVPIFELESFAAGTGYYRDLPVALRKEQMTHMLTLMQDLYPRMRLYVFDARKLYSAPVTIFGPLLVAIYTGGHYITFRDKARIETLTLDFDELVRQAECTARDVPDYLRGLSSLMT